MHPSDEQMLQGMLGQLSIPEDLETEVMVRTTLFHRAGPNGPIGPIALIDAVRSLGYKPKTLEKSTERVDWGRLPQDGRTRVEARFFGTWLSGVFTGFVEHGTLSIRLDDDGTVRECAPLNVRLVEVLDALPIEEPVPMLARKLDEVPDDSPEESPAPAEASSEELPATPEPAPPPPKETTDWSKVSAGAPVYVELGDDFADGEFVGLSGESLSVKVGGQEMVLDTDKVTYAGD